jgi:hypothetical protein
MTAARIDVRRVLDHVDLTALPAAYRMPMRCYLGRGDLPEGALRQVLEGNVGAALALVQGDAASLDVCRLSSWVLASLPAACHGSRDQVALFIMYLRRARGRALLATMKESA